MAQLRLEEPIVAVHGDRFILRSYSPASTIAGGVVLDPFASRHRAKELDKRVQKLHRLMNPDSIEKVRGFVAASELQGFTVENLIAATGWKREVVADVISKTENKGSINEAGGTLIARENFTELRQKVMSELDAYHKREPLARGLARETLRDRVFAHTPPELFTAVLEKLVSERLVVAEKDIVRAATHNIDLTEADSRLREQLEQIFLTAGAEAPSLDEALVKAAVAPDSRAQVRKILQLLIDDGSVVRINNEMFMHKTALIKLKSKLREYASEHEPDRLIDVGAFKTLAGVSRKYAIPLLEYFDRERITRRAGDKRLILK
jgi:selenocysteine-specific elongation factor